MERSGDTVSHVLSAVTSRSGSAIRVASTAASTPTQALSAPDVSGAYYMFALAVCTRAHAVRRSSWMWMCVLPAFTGIHTFTAHPSSRDSFAHEPGMGQHVLSSYVPPGIDVGVISFFLSVCRHLACH